LSKKLAEKKRLGGWADPTFPGRRKASSNPRNEWPGRKKITKGKKKGQPQHQATGQDASAAEKTKTKRGPRVGVREKSWKDVYSLHNILANSYIVVSKGAPLTAG